MPSKTSTTAADKTAIIAYVPALHAGYLSLFRSHPDASIFVLGKTHIDAFPRLNRDLRALDPHEAAAGLRALGFRATVLETETADTLGTNFDSFVLPDEDVSRDFKERYLKDARVELASIFLRWDGVFANKHVPITPDRTISTDALDRTFMDQAFEEAQRSADWWRQIGAVLVINGTKAATDHIRYFPSDLALDIFGTPRITVDAGERPDLYISMHAEAGVIAQAARDGILLKGASLYATTFPCINCAFLIARSGIAKLYYTESYSNLSAEDVLKSADVEIILVTDA